MSRDGVSEEQMNALWAAVQDVREELDYRAAEGSEIESERLWGSVNRLDHTLRAVYRELAESRHRREAVSHTFSILLIALVLVLCASCIWIGLN